MKNQTEPKLFELIARIKALQTQQADYNAPALTIAEANELEKAIRTVEHITNMSYRKPEPAPADERDSITITWNIDDVFDLAEREGREKPTIEQAREVLAREVLAMADKHHDANYGISWDTLSHYLHEVCGDSSADEDVSEGGAI
jgi:hypothetical protein